MSIDLPELFNNYIFTKKKQEEIITLTRAEFNTMIDLIKHTSQLQKEITELYLALLLNSINLPRA